MNIGARIANYFEGVTNEDQKSNAKGYEIILPPENQGGMKQQDVDYLMWKMSTGQVSVGQALRKQMKEQEEENNKILKQPTEKSESSES